jgi:hypothetical protein
MKAALLLAAVLLTATGVLAAQQTLGDAEIHDLLVGRSIVYADYSASTFGRDGAYSYVAANNVYYKGRYSIAEGKLCLSVDGVGKQCGAVGANALGLYLQTSSGAQLRFILRSPLEPQVVTRLCDTPLAYTVQTPQYGVSEMLRAYSGTWVGKWDFGMCAAVVFESIPASGPASIIYVNGSFGAEYPIKPGVRRMTVGAVGDKFTDGGRTTSLEFRRAGQDELVITSWGRGGVTTARLTRRP